MYACFYILKTIFVNLQKIQLIVIDDDCDLTIVILLIFSIYKNI